jgi:aminopeptidase
MPDKTRLNKLARLAVRTGVNVQKGQHVIVWATTEAVTLVREIVTEAYKAGAAKVSVDWSDDIVSHESLLYMDEEALTDVPAWLVHKTRHQMEEGACYISVSSPVPGLNADLDASKIQKASVARQKALSFFQTHMMGNKTQWTIVAAPNVTWAEKVFGDKSGDEAVEALWDAIFQASRVTGDNDPVAEWESHNKRLSAHNAILNGYNFKSLRFKNSLGTDLVVELVRNHVWAGGAEKAGNGAIFNPNIPTEENFTMPYKWGTKGKVVATKPLNYQGRLIEDFHLIFEDGKVVEFDAKKEKEALQNILDTDEGSRYIGEIALISHDSPISNTGILFLNTLFDENASCHMALGRAYPMNIKDGNDTPLEKLQEAGYNLSMVHSDFMFGSADMEITGTTHDGHTVTVFKDGNFVI